MNVTTIVLIKRPLDDSALLGALGQTLLGQRLLRHCRELAGMEGGTEKLRRDPSSFAIAWTERRCRSLRATHSELETPPIIIDNVFQSKRCEAAWIAAKFFGAAFHAGPIRGNDAITFVRVVFDPVLPAERCHPEAVDEKQSW